MVHAVTVPGCAGAAGGAFHIDKVAAAPLIETPPTHAQIGTVRCGRHVVWQDWSKCPHQRIYDALQRVVADAHGCGWTRREQRAFRHGDTDWPEPPRVARDASASD